MYVLIDKERMCITHKHLLREAIANVAHIEMAHVPTIICDEMDYVTFETFTDADLNKLLLAMCGQKYEHFTRKQLIEMTRGVCFSLYPSSIDGFAASRQADSISMKDKGHYKYQAGSNSPLELDEYQAAKPLTAGANPNAVLPPAPVFKTLPAARTAVASAPVKREQATNTEAPKHGSKTGRVWEIAEDFYSTGDFNSPKELRKMIIAACENEGINSSTASVQYGKWVKTKP